MQQLREVRCRPARDRLEIDFEELFRENVSGYDENGESENALVERGEIFFWGCSSEIC